ncbi:mannose-6-phosphate isomerase-like protein (cupin superfamily) [Desulfobaculum xiamenense]|uniref:Mannose-6-phosphate isomerase-like protein (Cupin superfamily) n=1 Tax=Desulfobaculum xiamenense TaxID=995050 RepID=A0A846QJV9_9BACT|nr:hypothetical protein [Desulfobaculum xiamenense]NJB69186.1 mannose-6-phosphate isomerase-like protein (cupin superfamily) [Desulfobaculum xiamenense]
MVERVMHANRILAIIVRAGHEAEGIEFFTPDSFSQQLAAMRRPAGHVIEPHVHNPVPREVHLTQEVLFVKRGRMRVDFYDDERVYRESRILATGDVILLAEGGHGFHMLEETVLIEVKQGPYAGEEDKTRYAGIAPNEAILRDPDPCS